MGGVIGSSLNSILAITVLALVSHFVLDMIPHWDGFFDKEHFVLFGKAEIDRVTVLVEAAGFLIGVALVTLIYVKSNYNWLVIYGAFISLLPDLIKIGYFTRLRDNKIYMGYLKFHARIQRDVGWKLGMLIQTAIIIVLLIIFF